MKHDRYKVVGYPGGVRVIDLQDGLVICDIDEEGIHLRAGWEPEGASRPLSEVPDGDLAVSVLHNGERLGLKEFEHERGACAAASRGSRAATAFCPLCGYPLTTDYRQRRKLAPSQAGGEG